MFVVALFVVACEQALLGPLEQQEVCVAKAGLVASLPARTSLLAAANPAGGQYNRAKTLLQNLKMSAAMLSRFDIIFVLLDQPDQRRDERLSEHVMAMHSGTVSSRNTVACITSAACCRTMDSTIAPVATAQKQHKLQAHGMCGKAGHVTWLSTAPQSCAETEK